MRVSQDMLDQTVAAVRLGIGQPIEKAVPFRIFDLVLQVALLLMAKSLAVGDQKLEIARVRLIAMRVVNFIYDAMAEREPEPAARVVRCAESLLGTGGPTRLNSRAAKGD